MKILMKLAFLVIFLLLLGSCTQDDAADPEDSQAPIVLSTDPQNGATDVSVATDITISFSEEVNPATLDGNDFEVTADGETITFSGTLLVDGDEAIIDPDDNLEYGTQYTITLDAGVEDLAGNSSSSASLSFTTEEEPDIEEPDVDSITPEDGATDVAIDENISVTFSELIDEATVNETTVQLIPSSASESIEVALIIEGDVLTIDPTADLEELTEYRLVLGTGIQDLAANGLLEDFESAFTTESLDMELPSIVGFSVFNGEEDIPVSAGITITFSEPIDPNSLEDNILFRKSGTTDYLNVSFDLSGNDVIVTPDEVMKGNVEYVLDVTVNVTDLAGNQLDFAGGRVFKTEGVPVTVVSMTPSDDAVDVEVDESIVITFSEDIEESSVSVFFSGPSPPSFSMAVNGAVLTISTTSSWNEFERDYSLTISTAEDVYGNALASSAFLSFTTIFVSENYYYSIRNYEVGDYLAFQDPSPQVTYSSTIDDKSLWSFVKSGDDFAISNKFLYSNNYNAWYLYSYPLHVDDELSYLEMISTGSLWSLTTPTNGVRAMYSRGNLFDGEALTMTSDQSTSSGYRWWYFTRESEIN